MVDIAGEKVGESKRPVPEMPQGAFDAPGPRVLHEDARAYLEKTTERFDLIVVDLVEPLEEGPACLLFTKEFYTLIRDRLTEHGVMTMQAGMTKVNEIFFHGAVNRTLKEVFPVVAPYQSFISCFGTPWRFILASKGTDPRNHTPAAPDLPVPPRSAWPSGELSRGCCWTAACWASRGMPPTRPACSGTCGRASTR